MLKKKDSESKRRARLFQKKRKWVNQEFKRATKGKHISNVDKTAILNRLWSEVNEKYGE